MQCRRELQRHLHGLRWQHSEVQNAEHDISLRGLSFERRLQRRRARLQHVDERLPGASLMQWLSQDLRPER